MLVRVTGSVHAFAGQYHNACFYRSVRMVLQDEAKCVCFYIPPSLPPSLPPSVKAQSADGASVGVSGLELLACLDSTNDIIH
jgi:hypothetical protein